MDRIINYYVDGHEVSKTEWYDKLNDEENLSQLSVTYEKVETIESLKKKIESLEKEIQSLKLEKEIKDKINKTEPLTIPSDPYPFPWTSPNTGDRYPWYPNIIYCERADWTVRPENLPQYCTTFTSSNIKPL